MGGAPARRVGLYDSDHVLPTQYANSQVRFVNEAGVATGISEQVKVDQGAATVGTSAWIARPGGETRRIGLSVTGVDTFYWVVQMNETLVLGFGNAHSGPVGWIVDIATGQFTELGLTDAEHTSPDGLRFSQPLGMTPSARYIWGWTRNFTNPSAEYDDQWIYDRETQQYVVINPLGGGTRTQLVGMDERGAAVGYIAPANSDPNSENSNLRAFIYLPEEGVRFLDEAVDVDITSRGWTRFTRPFAITPSGYIVGDGEVTPMDPNFPTRSVFLLKH